MVTAKKTLWCKRIWVSMSSVCKLLIVVFSRSEITFFPWTFKSAGHDMIDELCKPFWLKTSKSREESDLNLMWFKRKNLRKLNLSNFESTIS